MSVEQEPVTQYQIVSMCNNLAGRYKSRNYFDDLVSEGILCCYEILAVEPDAHPAKLYREAKRVMHDYINIHNLPVTVPAHNITRRLTRDIDDDVSGNMSEGSHQWLKSVLSSENMSYSEDFGESATDHVQQYEDREYDAYVLSVAITTLNQTEWTIIKMRYYEGMTQDMVADRLNTNQKWVSRHETTAFEKLRLTLCNNL